MANHRRGLPEDLKQLLDLIQKGHLFALQDWTKAGKRIRVPDGPGQKLALLEEATQTGFHSVVEELLRVGGWSQPELEDALDLARYRKRFDIADLLVKHGAQQTSLDFETACDDLDLGAMERLLRSGIDPNENNVFAQVLTSKKARPFLRFYRQFRAEFPALDDQAALALCDAVQHNQVRWTALLAWAGADPFRPVPNDLSGSFPVDPENSTTAAHEALWRNAPDILKVLHLNPTPEQAVALLKETAYRANSTLFRSLFSKANPAVINDTPLGGSSALDGLLRRAQDRSPWSTDTETNEETETLQCIEMLLDAGAKWRPATEELRYIRRALLKHDARYIVQVVRLLLYTPGAVDVPHFLEFCRYQSLASQIAVADSHLLQRTALAFRPFPLAPQPRCIHLHRELSSSLGLLQLPGPTRLSFIHICRFPFQLNLPLSPANLDPTPIPYDPQTLAVILPFLKAVTPMLQLANERMQCLPEPRH